MKPCPPEHGLQLTSAAERGDREKYEQQGDGDGYADQPRRNVPSPGTKCRIEPAKSEHGKNSADHFVKKLPDDPPEALKSAQFARATGNACRAGHMAILAEVRAGHAERVRWVGVENANLYKRTGNAAKSAKKV